MSPSHEPAFRRGLIAGLLVAIASGALCAALAKEEAELLWQAYFVAWLTWWPIVMGGLGLLALGNLTGGGWAAAGRPFYLAAGQMLPLLALLSLPLTFGLEHLYSWASQTHDGALHLSSSKAAYLSRPFFLARAAGYFVVWFVVAAWLTKVSRLDRPPASRPAMRSAGALSLVLLVPTATFAAFDWAMSLEPEWYSSIYGAILTAGGVVAAHALAILGLASVLPETRTALFAARSRGHDHGQPLAELFNDLGNLLLAFIMVWTYFSFSQFFLIWSANLPGEIGWYKRRFVSGWEIVAVVLLLICFVLPFLMLLSRDLKRSPGKLAGVAALLLIGFGINMYWTIVPALPASEPLEHVVRLSMMIGLGGLLLAICCWRLGRFDRRRRRAQEHPG